MHDTGFSTGMVTSWRC